MRMRLVLALAVAIAVWLAWCARRESDPTQHVAATQTSPPDHIVAGVRAPGAVASRAGATIDGRVIDQANAPIAGAVVCTLSRTPTCMTSDADGEFALTDLAVPDVREAIVAAQYPHYVIASSHPSALATAQHASIVIAMKSGGVALAGFVRDGGGGAIAHALVIGSDALTYSDHDGAYALWTAPTTYAQVVVAIADGYSRDQHFVIVPARVDFALEPEATISGRVVDATTGRPMPQIRVTATSDGTETTVADDDGRFRFDKLASAVVNLGVDDPHAAAIHTSSVPVGLGAHIDGVVIRVVPAFEVTGRVVDLSGGSCDDGRRVTLTRGANAHVSKPVDDAGVSHIGGLVPGTYAVNVFCAHRRASPHYDDIVVTDRDIRDQMWNVTRGGVITGRVLDADGTPVPAAQLAAHPIGPNTSVGDFVITAADGSFTLAGLDAGRYRLLPLAPWQGMDDEHDATVEVAVDREAHRDVVIDASSTLAGHVVFADGMPARGVSVRAAWVAADGAERVNETTADESGYFETDGLRGELHITLFEQSTPLPIAGADAAGVRVQLAPATTTQVELTTTSSTGEIRGRVLDEAGAPVDDAFVSVQSYDAEHPDDDQTATSEVMVAGDGTFVADHLPQASYRVRAYRKSGGQVVEQPVALGAELTLTIADAGTISGVVRFDGALVTQFQTRLESVEGRQLQAVDALAPDGTFTVTGIDAGHYRVHVLADGGEAMAAVDVVAGRDTAIELDLDRPTHVRGRAVDHATGEPLAMVEVSTEQSNVDNVQTDGAGHFDLVVPTHGSVEISLRALDGLTQAAITIVATGEAIDLGDVGLSER